MSPVLVLHVTPDLLGDTADELDLACYQNEALDALRERLGPRVGSIYFRCSPGTDEIPEELEDEVRRVLDEVHQHGRWVRMAEENRRQGLA